MKKNNLSEYSFYLQVFFHLGLTDNDRDFEVCLRVENVQLPKKGFFGLSAATGGVAGKTNYNKTLLKFVSLLSIGNFSV